MNDLPVRLVYGKINLKERSQRLAVFRVEAPFLQESGVNTGKRSGPGSTGSVPSTRDPVNGGGFVHNLVTHREGTVLMYQSSRTIRGRSLSDGWLFVRLRATAPKIQVMLRLPTGPESVLGDNLIVFTGNADVLTGEELDVLGFHLPGRKAAVYMNQEEIDELFDVQQIAAGSALRPQYVRVATAAGVVTRAVAAEPTRRMRLRR